MSTCPRCSQPLRVLETRKTQCMPLDGFRVYHVKRIMGCRACGARYISNREERIRAISTRPTDPQARRVPN